MAKKISDNKPGGVELGFQRIDIDIASFNQAPDEDALCILPTRNLVMFPGITLTIDLGRQSSIDLARKANEEHFPIGIICQLNPAEENPSLTTDLYKYGVLCDVLAILEHPDGHNMALVHSRQHFRVLGHSLAHPDSLTARIKLIDEVAPQPTPEFTAVMDNLRTLAREILKDAGELLKTSEQIGNDTDFVNFLCTNTPLDNDIKINLLKRWRIADRAQQLLIELGTLREKLAITAEIMSHARKNMDEMQRNAFLQQQMEAIRETLYGDEDGEISQLIAKADEAKLPKDVRAVFDREMEKMRRYNTTTPDYSVLYTYLDILTTLPWHKQSNDNTSLDKARNILDEDHYGLEKVKDRIIEQLALNMVNSNAKATILCLVGPPGVGKTSIGRSVARAMNRAYERVSFGGLHDESEIRGHRRTYIGAMPGRIIEAMKRAGVVNPVILLDEIDKIGSDYKGDPSAALLEVLDPEQNCHFHDNYIDVDYDLSKVFFIATANTTSTIPTPLLDRLEVIQLPGYLLEEKKEIATRHLLPRIAEKFKADVTLSDEALTQIIQTYTAESGVRALEKNIEKIGRRYVVALKSDKSFPSPVEPEHLYDLLGLAPYQPDKYEGNDYAGLVTGLAWTEVGGTVLMVESSLIPAKNPTLTLTGKLGDVMKESATIAFQWVKAHAAQLGIDFRLFDCHSLHIHFPEGAVPKDGPSAGITIATSIVSLFRQKRVKERIAMTGEITLRGKVLPVGGIREKILAAKRAGINTIIMSDENRRDIDDMPSGYVEGLNFIFVKDAMEVIAQAVTNIDVANPLVLEPRTEATPQI